MRQLTLLLFLMTLAMPALVRAQFTFTTNDDNTITITSYIGPGGSVIIPGTIDGYFVTSIGDYSFYYCANVTAVTIPDSITSIGEAAFFATSLTNVTIPASVTNIGLIAFGACYSLIGINVDTNNLTYSSLSGNFFNKNQTTFIQCPANKAGNFTISNSVTSLGERAFIYCTNLTSISIPNSVTNIGDVAFQGCAGLTNVVIPNSVTSIGIAVFADCTGLNSVTIPNSITSIVDEMFLHCSSLTNIVMPNNITSIGSSAFVGCGSLTSITIPEGVTNIGIMAFYDCTNLNSVYYSSDALGSDPSLFYGTVATIYYLPGTTGWSSSYAGQPTSFWLPAVLANDSNFGIQANQFGFNINWASGQAVVVETCTNLSHPDWQPVQTNTLTTGSTYFSDPQWTNYSGRFYRLRSP